MEKNIVKKIVNDFYGKIASASNCGCGCSCNNLDTNGKIAKSIGYTDEEIALAAEANLGLGCGNPTALADIKKGDTILDLGSGAGFDCFLAAKKTGSSGKVIGVDMTQEMIDQAVKNAEKLCYKNVEFRLGDIENLPIEDNSIDIIISNCVINLVPDKARAFQEAFRVLKKDGKMYVSDIVLLAELSEKQKNDHELLTGCVGGALLKEKYLNFIKNAGFKANILSEDKDISKRQYNNISLESIKIQAVK